MDKLASLRESIPQGLRRWGVGTERTEGRPEAEMGLASASANLDTLLSSLASKPSRLTPLRTVPAAHLRPHA